MKRLLIKNFGPIKEANLTLGQVNIITGMQSSGIYRYVLSGDLRDLSFRTFDKKQKREAYERQEGICVHCGKHFELEEMEADHITPWKEGGTTIAENCQMLCRNCNRVKGGR